MLEFIQKEIWVTEKEDINRSKLFNFFLPDNREALLAVNVAGKFDELITYEGLLQGKDMRSYVVCGSDMFARANRFYEILENRDLLLPILNTEYEIISFFRWNAQIERATFRMQDCDRADNIFISGCDEINIRILKQLDAAEVFKEKQIFLCGEGWEIVISQFKFSGSYQTMEQLPENNEAVLIKAGGEIDLGTAESYVTTYTLKEEYKSKRIFVYGANLDGQMILSNLEFMGVHVHGIIDDECEEENDFLIWPIVKSKDIIGQSDVIIVCERILQKEIIRRLECVSQLVTYEDAFQWDKSLNNKKHILLYESVHTLEKVRKQIELCCGEIEAELSVRQLTDAVIEEVKEAEGNLVFALLPAGFFKTDRYCYFLSRKLGRKIYRTIPYLHHDIWPFQSINPFVRIKNAVDQRKKFILYGVSETYGSVWQSLLRYLEIDFSVVVDEKSIYNLMYEDIKNIFLVLGFDVHKWHNICENLQSMGFSDRNVLGMFEFSELILDAVVDIQLGHVILYEKEELEQYRGFHIIGDEGKDKFKIVTLGGSTTAEESYRVKSWPACLHHRLNNCCDTVIYNGAVNGYYSCQELLKLLRDVCALRPDLIISFSGVNDLMIRENINPFMPPYLSGVWENLPVECFGGAVRQLPDKEELRGFDFWYKMQQVMQFAASIFGAEFRCFAQPIMYSQEYLPQERRWAFERLEDRESAIEFRKKAKEAENGWFVNLTDILDDKPQVFIDFMHVDEEGNNIIADHIYRHIEHILQQRRE